MPQALPIPSHYVVHCVDCCCAVRHRCVGDGYHHLLGEGGVLQPLRLQDALRVDGDCRHPCAGGVARYCLRHVQSVGDVLLHLLGVDGAQRVLHSSRPFALLQFLPALLSVRRLSVRHLPQQGHAVRVDCGLDRAVDDHGPSHHER